MPDEPGGTRLIDHASLMTLERMLAAHGTPVDAAMLNDGQWTALEPVLTQWIVRAARSLAHAIVSTAAVIDFEDVILDGPFPDDIQTRLCREVETQLDKLDLQGIMRPQIAPGSFGSVARAVGAAAGHITSRYMIDSPIGIRS